MNAGFRQVGCAALSALIAGLALAALGCERADRGDYPKGPGTAGSAGPQGAANILHEAPPTDASSAGERLAASLPASTQSGSPEEIELRSNAGTYLVRYHTAPAPIPANELFAIEFTVLAAATGAPVSDVEVSVDAAMPDHGHGMNTQPALASLGPGKWRAEGMLFHMPGYWELYFDVRRAGRGERAQAAVHLE